MYPVHKRILGRRSGAVGRPGVNLMPPPGATAGTRQLVATQCEQSRGAFIEAAQVDHPEYVTGSGDHADLTDAGLAAFYAANPVCAPAPQQPQPTPGAQALRITAPADGGSVATSMPTVAGIGVPGSVVRIALDGSAVAGNGVAAGADGAWSFPLPALSAGSHAVTVMDDAGNTAYSSFQVTVGAADGNGETAGGSAAPAGSISPAAAGVGAGLGLIALWAAVR